MFNQSLMSSLSAILLCLAILVPMFKPLGVNAFTSGKFFEHEADEDSDNRIARRGFKSSLLSTARGFGKRSSMDSMSAPASGSFGSRFGKANLPSYDDLLLRRLLQFLKAHELDTDYPLYNRGVAK